MPRRSSRYKSRKVKYFLDPDYRSLGWRDSIYAPRNRHKIGWLNITRISALTTIGIFVIFYLAWRESILPSGLRFQLTLFAGPVIFIVLWIVLGVLLRSLAWRRISMTFTHENDEPPEPEELDEPKAYGSTSPKVKGSKPQMDKPVMPSPIPFVEVDPIQMQLDERRKRLQGLVEPAGMTPKVFEHEVAWLINTLSRNKATVVGGAGDQGIDIRVTDFKGNLIGVVQCKRYDSTKPLPPGFIRELYASKQRFKVNKAWLVTTAYFTQESEREAASFGIELIDGAKLESMRKQAREVQQRGRV